jgi:hypothetical protein
MIEGVLNRLALLAEGGVSNLDPKTSHGSSESKIPPGVNLAGKPPSRDTSPPFEFWTWRFAEAVKDGNSDFELHRLYLCAERDYWTRKNFSERRKARRSGELTDNDVRDGGLAEREAAKRIVEEYEGIPAVEVAYLYEETSEDWIKKARREHKRNPNDGTPRSAFLDLDEDGRHRAAAEMKAKDMGYKTAADKLCVGRETLRRYWPKEEVAA